MKILITGGAGFIGSNFIHWLLASEPGVKIVNVDSLTYAGNLSNLRAVEKHPGYSLSQADIADRLAMSAIFERESPDLVIHFAAESHVDRSILDASAFVRTNVMGTQVLLDLSRSHGVRRFVQVSTDEVYGSLGPDDAPFTESNPIQPSSPYSASKAGADHLVLAAGHTHGFDVVVTRCSNNYGPYQFPEKFIPLFITRAMKNESLPLYGDGRNVRDWIHVVDHCRGVWAAAVKGEAGEVYNFGCDNEWSNIDVAREILRLLGKPDSLITLVKDRPGHDRRYAMGYSKAQEKLGWSPVYTFADGLQETIEWYRANGPWLEAVVSGAYRDYVALQYGEFR